jgi:hypothetical protein
MASKVVDSLKALDPNRPIREADVSRTAGKVAAVPKQTLACNE